MQRNIRLSEKLLLTGFILILIFMIVQDLVPLGPLNDVEAIAASQSFNELLMTTLIGVGQFLVLITLLLIFIGKKYPIWVKAWLIIHPSFIFGGALMAWWIPYFTGHGAADRAERYQQMFGDTHAFLPVMNGLVPNTLHTIFHFLLLGCIILAIYIAFKKQERQLSEPNFGMLLREQNN